MENPNFEEMLYKKRRILNWIQSQGAVFALNDSANEQVRELFFDILKIFLEYIKKLSAIYVYNQFEQSKEDLKKSDAIHWRDITKDIGTLHAIGLSTEALLTGKNYAILYILHEFAHIDEFLNHDIAFHKHLDHLIEHYNAVTGEKIENDYQGLLS